MDGHVDAFIDPGVIWGLGLGLSLGIPLLLVLLGLLLGGMMAIDMGGPINKASYAFATGLITTQIYSPMAAVMAGGGLVASN